MSSPQWFKRSARLFRQSSNRGISNWSNHKSEGVGSASISVLLPAPDRTRRRDCNGTDLRRRVGGRYRRIQVNQCAVSALTIRPRSRSPAHCATKAFAFRRGPSMKRAMAQTVTSDKLKVFISYSRRDSSEFAEELLAG